MHARVSSVSAAVVVGKGDLTPVVGKQQEESGVVRASIDDRNTPVNSNLD